MKLTTQNIYLDHAAATPLDAAVFAAMKPYLTSDFANPSALYGDAVRVKNAVEDARKTVADFLHTTPDCVLFTHGGTHSINAALLGAARGHKEKGKHIITTQIEHHAVLNTMKQLEKEGFEITYLPVDEYGFVSVDDVKKAIKSETILVSIMYANNEIGTIEPVIDIGKLILRHRKKNNTAYPLFHTDACQAAGALDMSVERLHVDLLSFNGSKIYGPKSAGVLYLRRDVEIEPIMFGGGQEMGLAPGTEDVAGIIGIAKAVSQINNKQLAINNRIAKLRNKLWQGILDSISDVVSNGPKIQMNPSPGRGGQGRGLPVSTEDPHLTSPYKGEEYLRLPNNLNVSFLGTDAEAIILYLDAEGVAVSSGSACTTDSDELSHVLTACGYDETRMKGSIRFTLGKDTTEKEIKKVLKVLPGVIAKVRSMNQ